MITLRKATKDDQNTIYWMILSEMLNPLNLHWQNFIVAEDEETGEVAGIGQVKLHMLNDAPSQNNPADVIKELASIVVAPAYRGQGVGTAIIDALEERAGRPLYLMCAPHNAAYYQRKGYVDIDDAKIANIILPSRLATWFIHRVMRAKIHIMKKT